jgi:hypothetical protein
MGSSEEDWMRFQVRCAEFRVPVQGGELGNSNSNLKYEKLRKFGVVSFSR